MAIVVPIITEYSDRGLKAAMREIRNAEGTFGKLSAATALIGPAFAAAGVAAGAFAVKMGVDGVQAAAAEQEELAKLDTTLRNLGWENATTDVTNFADQLARATTFDDTAIRTAFTNIAQTAPSATAAMDAVTVATDAAIGSGKSLESVSIALAKAQAGNTTALQRMFPWLDKNLLKTEGLDYATDALAQRFAGQATAAAQTWNGELGNTAEAFDELKESFGAGFLKGLDSAIGNDSTGVSGLSTALYELQPLLEEFGVLIGETAGELVTLITNVKDVKKAFDDWYVTLDGPWKAVFDAIGDATLTLLNPLEKVLGAINGIIGALRELSNMRVSLPSIPSLPFTASAPATRSKASAYSTGNTVNVTVNAGVGDPVAIARELERTLGRARIRVGSIV